jgi:hypothetical protein
MAGMAGGEPTDVMSSGKREREEEEKGEGGGARPPTKDLGENMKAQVSVCPADPDLICWWVANQIQNRYRHAHRWRGSDGGCC